jgi:histone acetyltransferase
MEVENENPNLEFCVVCNDDTADNMLKLIAVKNIFGRQLPKMPKDYIVKLVFDPRHQTFLMSRDGIIIGGCCFRPFHDRCFAEIVFLAVSASEQVKGYGTRLMSNFKQYCKTAKLCYLLTYADNFAIGYFKKQGFTENLSYPKEQWHGFIKDYDGGTLMGCPVLDGFDYNNLEESVDSHINETLAGITDFSTWTEVSFDPALVSKDAKPPVSLQNQLQNILDKAVKCVSSWPFREAVDEVTVPGYSGIIKNPMHLRMMIERNQRGGYSTQKEFQTDLKLMFDNCLLFNGPNSEITKRGQELQEFLQPKISEIVEYYS